MKILMLTPYLPYPPSSGGQIRSFNLIKELSKDHQITLYSLIKYDSERKYIKYLEKYCKRVKVFKRTTKPWTFKNIFKTASSKYPFLVIRNYSPEERKEIEKLLSEQKFDLIHAETFYVSPHIPRTETPIVLVDQTIEYQVYQHFVQNFKWKILKPILSVDVFKIKYWEEYYWKKASRVVAVSEADAVKMRKLVKGIKVDVVPNGVGEDLIEKVPLHYNKNILFMGNYAWLQNVEAAKILAKQVFPEILKKVPDAKLVIAGQNTDKIDDLQGENITLLNLSIEDIQGVKDAYQNSGVLVAPLYGPGGTRLKILGAMAALLPVVTTHVGIEGIDAENNREVLVGKTPKELAELTVDVLNNKDMYKKIATNARELVDRSYSYTSIAKRLGNIYKEVTENV